MKSVIIIVVSVLVLVLIGVDIYTTTELNKLMVSAIEKEHIIDSLRQQVEYGDTLIDMLTKKINTLEKQNEILMNELEIWQSFGNGEWSIEIVPSRTH